ncbi:MAG: hypothetical protein LKF61_05705 [Eggerthellaceae bacterium]|jgi:hypothetical protein|nr:hypothetical protein [Eggerthellaceae bacterium]
MTDGLRQNGDHEQARYNLASLFSHVAWLYTCGDSSSLSTADALQIAESIRYVLGLDDVDSAETNALLSRPDYQGLLVNLYDLIAPHESELMRKERPI